MVDVAAAAGVSPTTASFVLNGRGSSIPVGTRQRVLDTARELEYTPNSSARALATGRTNRIGIVLNTPDSFGTRDAYFAQILSGIVAAASRFNCNVLLHTARYSDWRELESDILSGSSDGVILVGRYASDVLTRALLDAEFPTVCTSYNIDHPRCYSVDCDNEAAARIAVNHLYECGHRNLVLFYPGEDISWGQERRRGARSAADNLVQDGVDLQEFTWTETELPTLEWCRSAIAFLKSRPVTPTGIVCCDEIRARTLLEMLPEHGMSVPEDVALVSFNSTEISARAHPPMTSVFQPLQEIGGAAVEMLVSLIDGQPGEKDRRLPVVLHRRMSCGAESEADGTAVVRCASASRETFVGSP